MLVQEITARFLRRFVVTTVLLTLIIGSANLAAAQPGTIVLAGGGSPQGGWPTNANPANYTTDDWSYPVYGALIQNGDVTSDGVVKVVILNRNRDGDGNPEHRPELERIFRWLGQQLSIPVEAYNITVMTQADANNPSTVSWEDTDIDNNLCGGGSCGTTTLGLIDEDMDMVFISGGDQGGYYDEWNGTQLETEINAVAAKDGAFGGTSAGSMSLAEYSFSGGMSMVSTDPLADAHTSYLDDESVAGTSGIHTDFFPFVSNTTIDTHFTQRGRLGRLLGVLAKAADDSGNHSILAIGIEQRTGVILQQDGTGDWVGEVSGIGSVSFIKETVDSELYRIPGRPLVYTNLYMDRLTEGWKYNVTNQVIDYIPATASSVSYIGDGPNNEESDLTIDGCVEEDREYFRRVAEYDPDDYDLRHGDKYWNYEPFIADTVGFTDCGASSTRGPKHETLFTMLLRAPTTLLWRIMKTTEPTIRWL